MKLNENTIAKEINRNLYSFVIVLMMIFPVFMKGMLTNEETRIGLAVLIVTAVGVTIDKIGQRDFSISLSWSKAGLIVLCGAYLLSIKGAANSIDAMYEWLKYVALIGLAIILNNTHFDLKSKMAALKGLYFAGVIAAIIGVDTISSGKAIALVNWMMGFVGLKYGTLQGMLNDFRMCSIFEYCNVYGTFTMISFLVGIVLVLNEKKMINKLIISSLQFIQLYLFTLTLSRGAYLVWGLALAVLLFTSKGYRVKIVFASLPAFLSMIVMLALTLSTYNSHEFPIPRIWQYIVVLTIVSAVIAVVLYYIEKALEKHETKTISKVISGILMAGSVLVILVIILVVTQKTIGARLDTVFADDNSAYRAYYYDTAYRIWRAYPLFGAGGGAFAELNQHFMVKSHDEAVYTHSYFFQVLVESGFAGIIGLFVLGFAQIKAIIVNFKRKFASNEEYTAYAFSVISAGMLLHSMMEYTFSFFYIFVIFIMMLTFADKARHFELVKDR